MMINQKVVVTGKWVGDCKMSDYQILIVCCDYFQMVSLHTTTVSFSTKEAADIAFDALANQMDEKGSHIKEVVRLYE